MAIVIASAQHICVSHHATLTIAGIVPSHSRWPSSKTGMQPVAQAGFRPEGQ